MSDRRAAGYAAASLLGLIVDAGATMGPHGVILPAARIGAGGTVGAASPVH
ncbi:hypothetical protein ACFVWT_08330 [Arthrobacter sp. NPDC058288]|uniref:hypothetical protein n=1 Tax=Arthrobacter sp. NPDC058288 TaxID=3346424 RepID=UPI0036F14704